MAMIEEVGNRVLNNTDQRKCFRPLADFPKETWGDIFTSYTFDEQVYRMLLAEVEKLKKEVRNLLMATGNDGIVEQLKLINTVERLGISYHFQEEIEENLEQIFKLTTDPRNYPHYDLTTAALQFRLLRQHGFQISCHIFDDFVDADGKLRASLSSDIEGLLSLYEAAQLRTKQDIILEDALAFATANLKRAQAAMPLTSSLGQQVKRALEQSLHKGHPRAEVRRYIAAYELEDDDSRNGTLLKLAKLDFNLLQMLYKQELFEIFRWWRALNIISRLGYTRDRTVECFYWALGGYYEPQYSKCRIVTTKTLILLTIIDDTYDAYGTLDELQIFTDAIERWDRKEIDQLPDYLKICYTALLDLSDEIKEGLASEERSYAIHFYNEKWKEYSRFSNIQAKWFHKKELPAFDEYMKVGLMTSSYNVIVAATLVLQKSATKQVFEWLECTPKIMTDIMILGRFLNDVGSYNFEKERDAATGMDCYMNHYNVTEEEAMAKLEEITEDAWKDFNEEWIKLTTVPRENLSGILGLARLSDVSYKHDLDGYTDPASVVRPDMVATLVDPIII